MRRKELDRANCKIQWKNQTQNINGDVSEQSVGRKIGKCDRDDVVDDDGEEDSRGDQSVTKQLTDATGIRSFGRLLP